MTTRIAAAWLLTYLIHSTLILAAVLLVSRALSDRRLALQEGLLRFALVAGLITATAQIGLGIAPLAGEISFASNPQSSPGAAADVAPPTDTSPRAGLGPGASDLPGHGSDLFWPTPFVVIWGLASMCALVAIARSMLDLRRLMRSRCFQTTGRLVDRLAAAMGLQRPVRISTSKAISVPFATGIVHPEICCPEKVNELAIEHRRGLFAHELAHLARRDPAWQLLYRLGEALFVLQPLNRHVRRRLEEIAEHLTDERAAAATGDRLGLARCLVVIAHWGRTSPIGLPATALAASGPQLDRRVRRLIAGTTGRGTEGRWTAAFGVSLLIGSTLILPRVGTGSTADAGQLNATWRQASSWSIAEDTSPQVSREPGIVTSSTPDDPTAESPPAARPGESNPTTERPPDAVAPAPSPPVSAQLPPPGRPLPDLPQVTAPPAPPSAPAPADLPALPQNEDSPAPPAPEAEPIPEACPTPSSAPSPGSEPEETAPSKDRDRESAERARNAAELGRLQRRLNDVERRELRLQRRAEETAARQNCEAAAVARDRAEAVAAEARVTVREAVVVKRDIERERRDELRKEGVELRRRSQITRQRASEAAMDHARALAEAARCDAEEAEVERDQSSRQER